MTTTWKIRVFKIGLALVTLLCTAAIVPRWWCGRDADRFFGDDPEAPMALARSVQDHLRRGTDADDFSTGAALFDAEWAFGSHVMAVLGQSQILLAHPDLREDLLPSIRTACDQLFQPELRAFGTQRWGSDGVEAPGAEHGHAYLGYMALALSVARLVDPQPTWADWHDALLEHLGDRLLASRTGLIETYPGEAYPVDVSSIVGALAVHARVTGTRPSPAIGQVLAHFRARYLDPTSGLLVQTARADTGDPESRGRGSGTALATFFLSFADRDLAQQLYGALEADRRTFLGFGGAREYGRGSEGRGDVDSGPVVLGIGVSTTGFMLAGARVFRDQESFTTLMRTTTLFGMPDEHDGRLRYAAGGPLGDAILLAMLTAGPGAAP